MENNEMNFSHGTFDEEKKEEPKKRSALVVAGMVLGIIAISTSFIPIINNASFVMGILALIFGSIGIVKKRSKGKAIAALVLGILAIVITLSMQSAFDSAIDDATEELDYMTGDKTDEILDDYLDVEIGSFEVIEGEYIDDTELVVKLKNKSDEKRSFDVQIEAVDASGNRIDTDYIYANDLGAGQSQEFKIFTFVSDDDLNSMKYAKFRIVEVSMY